MKDQLIRDFYYKNPTDGQLGHVNDDDWKCNMLLTFH